MNRADQRSVQIIARSIRSLADKASDTTKMGSEQTMHDQMTLRQYGRFLSHLLYVLADKDWLAMEQEQSAEAIAAFLERDANLQGE